MKIFIYSWLHSCLHLLKLLFSLAWNILYCFKNYCCHNQLLNQYFSNEPDSFNFLLQIFFIQVSPDQLTLKEEKLFDYLFTGIVHMAVFTFFLREVKLLCTLLVVAVR